MNIYVISRACLYFDTIVFVNINHTVVPLKDADKIASSGDPYQTAPLGVI